MNAWRAGCQHCVNTIRSTKSRPYRMRRRAEQVDQTRLRITEAAVRLHTTVGPAHTRSRHRRGGRRHPPHGLPPLRRPRRASSWPAWRIGPRRTPGRTPRRGPRSRISTSGPDEPSGSSTAGTGTTPTSSTRSTGMRRRCPCPPSEARDAGNRALADALIAGHADDDSTPDGDGRLLRAVARHLVDFWTWRSLVMLQGLDDDEPEVAVTLLTALAGAPRRDAAGPPIEMLSSPGRVLGCRDRRGSRRPGSSGRQCRQGRPGGGC